MIVADSSVLIPWAEGIINDQTDLLQYHIGLETVCVVPISLTELLSARDLKPELQLLAEKLTLTDIQKGYWMRAGVLRGRCLAAGRRARLADTLIAQACIDADLPLLTNDADFCVFEAIGGLKLVKV